MKRPVILMAAMAVGVMAALADTSNYVSKVWSPDNGDGTYTNPVLNADYSDPDVICVDGDYFLTASSFCNIPALPILHSRDLVNWEIVNYAIKDTLLPAEYFATPRHGDGVWAPAIRYHNGEYYIYWGDPDNGIYMVKTSDPYGEWEAPVLVAETKGIIDTCPLWDEDGRAYMVNGWAKSRSGVNSVITVTEMAPDGKSLIGKPVMVYDGIPDGNHTIEGPKFYKRNGYYYIMAPAGGVATGWQVVLRSKSPYGPYEMRVVMKEGDSGINGPHQGGWVSTPEGEDWFMHFQDKGIIGRVVHLNPVAWVEDWPVIGEDKDGDGCGEPVKRYRKPKTSEKVARVNPVEDDEFDSLDLGLQWEWFANYALPYGFTTPNGYFRLYGHTLSPEFVNMREVPNILTQKFPNESFTATAKMTVGGGIDGQQAGIIIMGLDYCRLAVEKVGNEYAIKLIECVKSDKGKPEKVVAEAAKTIPASHIYGEGGRQINDLNIWMRVKVDKNEDCVFSYSLDGKKFHTLDYKFRAREGHWIGARVGFFAVQPKAPRGWVDIDWIRFDK